MVASRIALALAVFGLTSPIAAQQAADTTHYRNPAVPGVMSFMIPGLGQLTNKQPVKGLFVFGSTIGLIAMGTSAEDKANEAFADCVLHTKSGCEEDIGGEPFIWAAAGMWMFAILDAAFTADHLNDSARSKVTPTAAPDGRVGLVLSIPTR